MEQYKKLPNTPQGNPANSVNRLSDNAFIPFDPANMDFVAFKQAINSDEAQLEDADGVLMTEAEAKAFVATLP